MLKEGDHTSNDLTLAFDQSNGGFHLHPQSRTILIRSIEQWTSAMLTFVSIYTERHGSRSRDMLKYMNIVRTTAASNYNWREYDIQFRLRQATRPEASWGSVDTELWLLVATAQPFRGYGADPFSGPAWLPQGGQQRQRQPAFRGGWSSGLRRGAGSAPSRRQSRPGFCFAFNAAGKCVKGKSCQYLHKCIKCEAASHGEFACNKGQTSASK